MLAGILLIVHRAPSLIHVTQTMETDVTWLQVYVNGMFETGEHVQERRRGLLTFRMPNTANIKLNHKGSVGKNDFKKTRK